MPSRDTDLERFDPLGPILFHDRFDRGLNGWIGLIGNYEDSLDKMLPVFRPMNQPMLSTAVSWDSGSHGAMSSAWAMKIATRPIKGAMNLALKRVAFRKRGPVQVEAWLTAKPEASDPTLSIEDLRSFGIFMDLQSQQHRGLPHIRFLNCLDGEVRHQWQYKERLASDHRVSNSARTRSLSHLAPTGWDDLPDGRQTVCYNELPTKFNWQYLRLVVDTADMSIRAFQFNDRHFDVSSIGMMKMEPWANLDCMLNVGFFVETDSDKRAFLYVDSVLVSGVC